MSCPATTEGSLLPRLLEIVALTPSRLPSRPPPCPAPTSCCQRPLALASSATSCCLQPWPLPLCSSQGRREDSSSRLLLLPSPVEECRAWGRDIARGAGLAMT